MSETSVPPLARRWVPSQGALGSIARFAFWPLAFVGARALSSVHPTLLGVALILLSLVASTLSGVVSRRSALVGVLLGGIVIAVPSYGAARAVLRALGGAPAVAVVGASVGALGGGVAFARLLATVRKREALDARVLALAPAATWMAFAAVLMRYGAEAQHVHVVVPKVALVFSLSSALVALLALFTLRLQVRWTRAVYQTEAVRPSEGATAGQPLSAIDPLDAIVASVPVEPYRSHAPTVARVPRTPDQLLAHFERATRQAGVACATAVLAVALVSGARAKVADVSTNSVTALPRLPAGCAKVPPMLRFVTLGPLRLVDAERIAARYRTLGFAGARVDGDLPFDARFSDAKRGQVIAERVTEAARKAYPPNDRDMVVVLTDRDIYISSLPWRFAFASSDGDVAIVSVRRLDATLPWLREGNADGQTPHCTAMLYGRTYKMITRSMLRGVCEARPIDDPKSLLRPNVLSVYDVDAMQETYF